MPASLSTILAVIAFVPLPQNDTFDTPEAAKADPAFAIQGEYVKDGSGVQVVAQGDGDYLIVIFKGGLPGDGWNGRDRQSLEGDVDDVTDLTEGYTRIERKSPTLNAKPPTDAVVLFDGSKESLAEWNDGARITDDGLLIQGVTSKQKFKDFKIHLEFRTPYKPKARGQGRGNSGLYYQGRYETQVLDSFGLTGEQNETGGIYSIRKPDLNMCFPPLTWQTYDGEFRAARYENGKKISNAVLTVRLNGVTVQSSIELPKKTTAAPVNEGPEPGPIYLQDHGNPVRYRNIWVQPIDSDQEARRPIVPAFERFHASTPTASTDAGVLLAGELNCLACHQASASLTTAITTKQAPILSDVGSRLRSDYVWKFLQSPHQVKPGTTMPSMLGHLPEAERKKASQALTSFLSTTGSLKSQKTNPKWAKNGGRLFHEIGCIACHMPQNGKSANPATSIPLGDLGKKYSVIGLTNFLRNPHAVRPSGRMPGFELNDDDSRDLAHFLVGDVEGQPEVPNVKFTVYNQGFAEIPDLDKLTPALTGEVAGFDVYVARRKNDFSIRFESFLKIDKQGRYKFHLGSDDGSLLFIDDEKVVDVDGVHPHTTKTGTVKLSKGVHKVRVDYSEVGGEESLALEIEGPGIGRQPIDGWLTLNEDGSLPDVPSPTAASNEESADEFVMDRELIEDGRKLFGSLGCASCHQLKKDNWQVASTVSAPELASCDSSKGCLGSSPTNKNPNYDLNSSQRSALASILSSEIPVRTTQQTIAHTMKAFNCYACHERGSIGGPEPDRHALFVSQIPEMGDEGRIPPPLNGVGDKLQADWLKNILAKGAKDRPYMLTRMPRFGNHAKHLADAFIKTDRVSDVAVTKVDAPPHRLISNGRKLVGSEGLSCVKCHTFGKYKASGTQAIDLQKMANRINEDWFHRYLPNPDALRPGTRMPTAFPNGKSVVPEIYDGETGKQVAAIWEYLKEGDKAKVPVGVMGGIIELKPTDKPVIYRNFIAGLSPRGIAIGYPEGANLAWDADRMAMALIWHGRFIDSSMHWQGRGQGRQQPLGDNTLTFETTAPIAALADRNEAWPTAPPKESGYRFRGYKLDTAGRPAFRYATDEFEVSDLAIPSAGSKFPTLNRQFQITSQSSQQLYLRAAVGTKVNPVEDGWYVVDGALRIRVRSDGAFLRNSAGQQELLVPIDLNNGSAAVVQEIAW